MYIYFLENVLLPKLTELLRICPIPLLSCPSPTFHSHLLPSLPLLPFSLLSSPSLSFLRTPWLEVGPLKSSQVSRRALWALPAGSEVEPQRKWNLVNFCLKMWCAVSTIFIYFAENQLTKFSARDAWDFDEVAAEREMDQKSGFSREMRETW